jgi:SAM-dependent methyltransferase
MAVSTHLNIDLGEYDARIRTFIPNYEEMLDAAVAALPAASRPIRTLVDLGIGTGALAGRMAKAAPRARLIGIDEDQGMLAMAARRLPRRRTTLVCDSFLRATLPRADAVTASFALHHIEHHRDRKALYLRIAAALRRGGVLISADCHPPADAALAARGRLLWRDHLASAYGRREAERFLRAWSHEDFYVPLPVELATLHEAGLTPEVTWRRDAFAVIVATPTSSARGRPRRR